MLITGAMTTRLYSIIILLELFSIERGFYVPGVAPVEFRIGDSIEVKAIKLTSTKTIVPYEYYYLPFCRPDGDLLYKSENLGEVMRGDRIVNTPYQLFMKKNVACASACTKNEPVEVTASEAKRMMDRIKEDYHAHLLVDNLPSATKYEIPKTGEVFYDLGYKIGWVDEEGKVFLNNHLDIVMLYHEHMPGLYRVVGFEVKPRSVKSVAFNKQVECTEVDKDVNLYELEEEDQEIYWTYSVTWEPSDIPWASRWDVYLSVKAVDIHWFSILNSIVVVFSLSGFLSVSIVRAVRRDIAHYNKDEVEDDTLEETGWKLVHGDVFRPPPHQMILVNMVGTGIQLLGMVGIVVFFAMLGMLSPASRGSLMSAAVFLFCFMGLVSGYQAGRLYKTLKGRNPIRCAIQTGTLFPTLILGSGFVLNFFLIVKQSSGAIPFGTMIALLLMWFGIDLPLVFLGFYFGYRKQVMHEFIFYQFLYY
uniref:Transmembrane 9 superfamily member n=1 Tax=Angiostrongylus cantonensis TaxID=6313 RepID=A0A0K0D1H6_ANGCA